jgi:hypothetical protein
MLNSENYLIKKTTIFNDQRSTVCNSFFFGFKLVLWVIIFFFNILSGLINDRILSLICSVLSNLRLEIYGFFIIDFINDKD